MSGYVRWQTVEVARDAQDLEKRERRQHVILTAR